MALITLILALMALVLFCFALIFRIEGASVFAALNPKLLWIPMEKRRLYLRPTGITLVNIAWIWLVTALLLRWFLVGWPW